MNAQEINSKIRETLENQVKVYPVNNLSASRIGHPCERYLFLLLKHWDEQKPYDASLQAIFNLGNSIEDYTINQIKIAGFEVITPEQSKCGNFKFDIKGGIITGREDLRIKDEKGELLPVEVKGLTPLDFNRLNTIDDFFKSKKAHIQGYPAQLQMYLYYFNKEKGFFAITNKLTGQVKFIDVKLDFEYTEKLLQKAERIYKAVADDTLPDACDDINVCENCPLQHICGSVKRIETNIETDDELENLINRKEELKSVKKEYDEVDQQIKDKVGDREKIITGTYLIERKSFVKKAFTVPESVQYRIQVKRL